MLPRRSARSNARAKSRCEVNRSRPRLAYWIASRCTTGGGGGWSGCLDNVVLRALDDAERQELATGGARLDLGSHGRADAAVVAGRPPAVVDLDFTDRVLPVLPHPVLVEAGVEVVPRQHFGELAFARREPVERHGSSGEGFSRAALPTLVGEVLAPPVEPSAVRPHSTDDGADATVAARQQS